MKPSQILSLLSKTIPARIPVLLTGEPGVAKTDLTHQAAAAAEADLITFHPVVSDPTDFKGMPWVGADNIARFLPFNELKKLIDATKLTVAFFDDLGQAPYAVQAACMQLFLARRINDHVISPNVVFIAATNRRTDKAGVSGLLEPVKSRFATIVPVEVDPDEWVAYALRSGVPTEVIAFIRFRPGLLHKFTPTNDLINSPSPRTVVNVGKLFATQLDKSIEYEAYAGAAGDAFAAEFTGFLRIARELPTRESILLNPEKATVPVQPAALFAVSAMLAACATKENFDAIIKYSVRMPDEFSVVMVKDAMNRNKDVTHTRAFLEWASDHSQVLT